MTSPLRSMTGFGAAARERDGLRANVELRAVNQRGLRVNVRSRPGLGPLEKRLRDTVGGLVRRGNVDVSVELIETAPDPQRLLNRPAAAAAAEALRTLADELDLDPVLRPADLLRVPAVLEADTARSITEAEWPLVAEALDDALAQLDGMRTAEGDAAAAVLREHIAAVARFRDAAAGRAPEVIDRVRQRLTARLQDLRNGTPDAADEQALERELVLFADRADVTEEIDRLGSHVDQFLTALDRGGEAGKRLEFLAQELLREVNTIASKCNDTAIAGDAVEAKLAAEKIKEQTANLE